MIRWWPAAPMSYFHSTKVTAQMWEEVKAWAEPAKYCTSLRVFPFVPILCSATEVDLAVLVLNHPSQAHLEAQVFFRAMSLFYCLQQTLGQKAHLFSVSFMWKVEAELNTLSQSWNWSLQQYQPLEGVAPTWRLVISSKCCRSICSRLARNHV